MAEQLRSVCCIGAGYVGGPTCAVIAHQLPDVQVAVVDIDEKRIQAWNSDDLPVYEPGLANIVKTARDGTDGRTPNLVFSVDVDRYIRESELIFIAVNTPTKNVGYGAQRASDLQYLESAVRMIASVATSDKIVVEKSTVPCRTAASMSKIFSFLAPKSVNITILSNPEFLAEGTAIENLMRPDRVLIGSAETEAGRKASQKLKDLYARWVPAQRVITMDVASSELAKLAANAYLAQRISSINSLSAICELVGADIDNVAKAMGSDQRIGPKMLKASVGFGGSCFQKDVMSLVWLAQTLHLPEVAAYWEGVVIMNQWQTSRFSHRIISGMNDTLTAKRIAVLGFAYKKNTGDTRMSPAINLVRDLLAERALPVVYDPQVRRDQIDRDIKAAISLPPDVPSPVQVTKCPYEACTGADAVVILTEWEEFRDVSDFSLQANAAEDGDCPRECGLSWAKIRRLMRNPAYVFDGRNILRPEKLRELGFRVQSIGKADPTAWGSY